MMKTKTLFVVTALLVAALMSACGTGDHLEGTSKSGGGYISTQLRVECSNPNYCLLTTLRVSSENNLATITPTLPTLTSNNVNQSIGESVGKSTTHSCNAAPICKKIEFRWILSTKQVTPEYARSLLVSPDTDGNLAE